MRNLVNYVCFWIILLVPVIGYTILILPQQFAKWRTDPVYNPYKDIRSNLFHHYHPQSADLTALSSYYYIVTSDPTCTFSESNLICIECQTFTRRLHPGYACPHFGKFLKHNHYKQLHSACRGSLIRISRPLPRSCPHSSLSYIFI
jgi:hypothetical protein